MKFGTQTRSSLLIMNIIFEIADLDPKLNTLKLQCNQNCNVTDFYKIWHSEQIEHANYEYINWN